MKNFDVSGHLHYNNPEYSRKGKILTIDADHIANKEGPETK